MLTAQLSELQDEIEARREAFTLEFGIEPWLQLTPRKLGPLLDNQVWEIRVVLAQTQREQRLLGDAIGVRRGIKQTRQAQKQDDDDPFGLPF